MSDKQIDRENSDTNDFLILVPAEELWDEFPCALTSLPSVCAELQAFFYIVMGIEAGSVLDFTYKPLVAKPIWTN